MEDATAEIPPESKLPTSPRPDSSPEAKTSITTNVDQPAETMATPVSHSRKSSKIRAERSSIAEVPYGASSSRAFSEPRRRSMSRKRSSVVLSPPGLPPESSRHDLYRSRKSSFPAAAHSSRKSSRASIVHSEPSTITSRKLSPKSSISTPSSSPNEIPMKFMSIDLEKELPEIFSTSLNPSLQDPDMSEFYSRIKSPPPVYLSRKYSTMSSTPSYGVRKITRGTQVDPPTRYKVWLALFVFVFFLFPIGVLIVFRLIPAFLQYLDSNGVLMVGPRV